MAKQTSKKSSKGRGDSAVPVSSVALRDNDARASGSTLVSTLSSSVVDGDRVNADIGGVGRNSADIGDAVGAARMRAAHAHALAADATQDANVTESCLLALREKHKKVFLMKAFGINPDGTKIEDRTLVPDTIPKYRLVKSVEQYEEMIDILSNWGDDDELADMSREDLEYSRIVKFR